MCANSSVDCFIFIRSPRGCQTVEAMVAEKGSAAFYAAKGAAGEAQQSGGKSSAEAAGNKRKIRLDAWHVCWVSRRCPNGNTQRSITPQGQTGLEMGETTLGKLLVQEWKNMMQVPKLRGVPKLEGQYPKDLIFNCPQHSPAFPIPGAFYSLAFGWPAQCFCAPLGTSVPGWLVVVVERRPPDSLGRCKRRSGKRWSARTAGSTTDGDALARPWRRHFGRIGSRHWHLDRTFWPHSGRRGRAEAKAAIAVVVGAAMPKRKPRPAELGTGRRGCPRAKSKKAARQWTFWSE